MFDDTTQSPMVPTGTRRPNRKHRFWAAPLALLGLGVPVTGLVMAGISVDRWGFAPGEASAVKSRLSFDALPSGVTVDHSKGEILFVTVSGSHLNALQYALGRRDRDLRTLTRAQRFGQSTPEQDHQIDLQMMRDAKDVAEYIAYQRLGLGGKLKAGAVVVEQVLCLNGRATIDKACDTPAPAGKYLERGSVITAVDGIPTPTLDDLPKVMARHHPGDMVTIRYKAPGSSSEKEATWATIAPSDDPTRPLIGFAAHDTYSVVLPFKALINTDAIGGPSAGLAFTLTLIDELSPGSLTGGKKVAVTGTINDDGTVGAIGGLHQKVVAVKQAGAKYFIVPKAQGEDGIDGLAEARRVAGPGLEIVPVGDLEDALDALVAHGGVPLPDDLPGSHTTG
jgi:PDZ domain-containing protein